MSDKSETQKKEQIQNEEVQQLDEQIETLKQQLSGAKGCETEVYTRIVGYYRSVRNWNKGKREEYDKRVVFSSSDQAVPPALEKKSVEEVPVREENTEPVETAGNLGSYLLFVKNNCPYCPSVKRYMAEVPLAGTIVNVDEDEGGMDKAVSMNVLGTPTVVLYDDAGNEFRRVNDVPALRSIFETGNETLARGA
ncbi:MAG: hypothetical protein K9L68_12520 [Spirochaetales bacterium]|nr:hypothetical protein [Spirochaetales bacterium]MCF7939416.1 hypothetical protein [Spirochaetales bacterium]